MQYPKVITGDCRKELPKFSDVDLMIADPPFNIGQDYADYEDKLPKAEYRDFTVEWVNAVDQCLRPGGTALFHVGDSVVETIFWAAQTTSLTRVDWAIWHYRFGQSIDPKTAKKLINSKAHLLVYVKPPLRQRYFDPTLVVSDRRAKYKDQRTEKKKHNKGERVALDVWRWGESFPGDIFGFDEQYYGRVQGNNAERVPNCPNQLPEVYIERVVRAHSREGDLVIDPFAGSGTTVVVATALGRRCVTMDCSETCTAAVRRRLEKGPVRL